VEGTKHRSVDDPCRWWKLAQDWLGGGGIGGVEDPHEELDALDHGSASALEHEEVVPLRSRQVGSDERERVAFLVLEMRADRGRQRSDGIAGVTPVEHRVDGVEQWDELAVLVVHGVERRVVGGITESSLHARPQVAVLGLVMDQQLTTEKSPAACHIREAPGVVRRVQACEVPAQRMMDSEQEPEVFGPLADSLLASTAASTTDADDNHHRAANDRDAPQPGPSLSEVHWVSRVRRGSRR
jgi:hypothetical protein